MDISQPVAAAITVVPVGSLKQAVAHDPATAATSQPWDAGQRYSTFS
jgi:hypothetical protein